MDWHKTNLRQLAWKGEKDPYKIWLSEVIMQQTRAEQGSPYYLAFIENYPTLADLAQANDEDVFRLWQGLGYYNRCRNMLETARQLWKTRNGNLPETYAELLALKGIGPYTAAAIASLAYNLPYAVVDGNVVRVLSRFFGIRLDPQKSASKRYIAELAQAVLDPLHPGSFNQAIMDFGATICTPKQVQCHVCPLVDQCVAFESNSIHELPVQAPKRPPEVRHFNYYLLRYQGFTWLHKRTQKDIWQNLYEFHLVETAQSADFEGLIKKEQLPNGIMPSDVAGVRRSASYVHKLSHQTIKAQFLLLDLTIEPALESDWVKTPLESLDRFAMPRLITRYLQDNPDTLAWTR